jgi:hypothetical protein
MLLQTAWARAFLLGALSLIGAAQSVRAQDSEFLTVKLGDQTIREIAQKYLGDPDLWTEILRSSGLKSITELRPGIELKLPANAISTANKALVDANGQIQTANQAGAQIFAIENITKAIALHDEALTRRVKSDWGGTRTLATQSFGEATVALEKSQAARDRAAEALVTDRHGQVEGQRPQDLGWRGLQLQTTLIEEERVRTLSDSTAQITFRDASRLRLNANSNAVIQRLRYDPLKRSEVAKVSLVEGDFYALLASPSTRASFNVEVPRVNASIDSGNFWVRNDDDGAKFTNYDDGAVEVTAAGESVTLGRNEGTIVKSGSAPREALAVLRSPSLTSPPNETTAFNRFPRLVWSPVPEAVGYWIEIGGDQGFSRMIVSRFGLDQAEFDGGALPPGEYFWRVAALDSFGLPGARSAVWRFVVTVDNDPPFLTIRAPERDAILRNAAVSVSGESEPGASVTVEGRAVTPAADGRFQTSLEAKPGANKIEIVATDPAGNETRRERAFVFMPDERSVVAFDGDIPNLGPKHFLSAVETISIGGTTTANAQIRIRAGERTVASAASNAAGRFRFNVPLGAGTSRFEVAVTAPSGFASSDEFSVTVDRASPDIVLDAPPPSLTATPAFSLRGRTKPGAKLALNGREIANRNGRFEETVELKTGTNTIELTASDAAGNVKTEKWQVRLDREPPLLVRSRVAPAGGGRPVLIVEVEAEDASGLATVAPFKVTAGGQQFTGHLRFNRAAKNYQGTIIVPAGALQQAALSEVELADDAGNKKLFELK